MAVIEDADALGPPGSFEEETLALLYGDAVVDLDGELPGETAGLVDVAMLGAGGVSQLPLPPPEQVAFGIDRGTPACLTDKGPSAKSMTDMWLGEAPSRLLSFEAEADFMGTIGKPITKYVPSARRMCLPGRVQVGCAPHADTLGTGDARPASEVPHPSREARSR